MRQFIAIPLPEKVIAKIEDVKAPFRGIKGLKPVRSENLHLTLLFLGDTGTDDKIARLGNIIFKPFTLSTTSVKLFPERKPRLIWIELKDSYELVDLYNKIAPIFEVNEGYKAHITIARIKWLLPQDYRFIAGEIDLANPFETGFTVNNFNLYSSQLRPDGPVYRVVESFHASPVKDQ